MAYAGCALDERLAQIYPLKVFPDAVGLGDDGRENLLNYGDMIFNSMGPRNELPLLPGISRLPHPTEAAGAQILALAVLHDPLCDRGHSRRAAGQPCAWR